MQRHGHSPSVNMSKRAGKQKQLYQYGGRLPAFHGVRIQRGYGLGSLFGSLARAAMPLLKQGAKTIGKAAVRTGFNIAKDVLSGQNVKTAAKNRARETGARLVNKAVKSVQSRITPQTGSGIKRKSASTAVTSTPVKRARASPPRGPNRSKRGSKNSKGGQKAKKSFKLVNEDIFGLF